MPSVLFETVRQIPNIANLEDMDPSGASASGADKKRNKLGYHRTSVACVHCRRRKIRCLVSADSQGRCENCIRLRKECQFYPVDQQPPTDRKTRPGMKMETPSSSADPSIASSSPPPTGLAAGAGSMDPNELYHYQMQGTTPEMNAAGFNPPEGYSVAPMGAFTTSTAVPHPELVPSQIIDTNATWDMAGNPSPVMWNQGAMIAAAQAPPHPHDRTQSISAGIPHNPHHAQMLSPAAAAAAAAASYTVQPDGSLWPVPPQSAMATVPSQPDIYHQGYPPDNIPPELKRSMTHPAAIASPVGPGGGQPHPSPLQSPQSPGHHLSQVPVPINYAGQQIPFHPQQWNPGMNPGSAVPMVDGTYAAVYTPENYQMTGHHPTAGP